MKNASTLGPDWFLTFVPKNPNVAHRPHRDDFAPSRHRKSAAAVFAEADAETQRERSRLDREFD